MLQTSSLKHEPPVDLDSVQATSRSFQEKRDMQEELLRRQAAIWAFQQESAQAAIRAFIEKHDVPEGLMPTNQQLIAAGCPNLKKKIARLGGMRKVAASMNLLCSTAQYPTLDLAVKALQQFAQEQYGDPSRAPSYARLLQADRSDLIVSYKKFGCARVRKAAGMTADKPSRHKGTAAGNDLVYKSATCCSVLLHVFNGDVGLLMVIMVHDIPSLQPFKSEHRVAFYVASAHLHNIKVSF